MTATSFIYQAAAQRVRFGPGSRHSVAEESRRAAITRAIVVATPEQAVLAEEVAGLLEDVCGVVFAGARMHTPLAVTEAALSIVREEAIDGIVSVGGGSATGLSKAIALRTDFSQVVLPTTYAGSEMTDVLGETVAAVKDTRRDPKIRPETVIYDVELTLSLPVLLSVTSGMNAIAHAVEGLYAQDSNPLIQVVAEEAIRALASAVPRIVASPRDVSARHDAQYGAWLCGSVLGVTSMALHHKLCHVLGGTFDLPHAETHTVLLPHVVAFNAPATPDAMVRLERALETTNPAAALFDLAHQAGAPTSLREIGMPEAGLDRALDVALAKPYWNPRALDRQSLGSLFREAWEGHRPRARAAVSE